MRVNCRTSHKKTSVIQTWLEPHGINLLGSFILYEIQLIKHRKTATEIEIKEEKEKIVAFQDYITTFDDGSFVGTNCS